MGGGGGGYMPVRTVASQSKIYFFAEFCVVYYAQGGAFYALLSLDSLYWVGLF